MGSQGFAKQFAEQVHVVAQGSMRVVVQGHATRVVQSARACPLKGPRFDNDRACADSERGAVGYERLCLIGEIAFRRADLGPAVAEGSAHMEAA
jgi:hypothetical protein